MNCENCKNEHNGLYGSGRFCSANCARSFSTKAKRKEINEKVSKTLSNEPVEHTCPQCKCKTYLSWSKQQKKFCSNRCSTTFYMSDINRRKLASNIAKKINLGGNKNSYAHGWYDSVIAGRVYLESSYEYKVAVELDKHNVKWSRPKFLTYANGKKYYPDFYLHEYDVYLDPKNDYLITKDLTKINQVIIENKVKIIILDKNHLTWNDIKLCLL